MIDNAFRKMYAMLVLDPTNETWFEPWDASAAEGRREAVVHCGMDQPNLILQDQDFGVYHLRVVMFSPENRGEISPANFLMLFPFRLHGRIGFVLCKGTGYEKFTAPTDRSWVRPIFSLSEDHRSAVIMENIQIDVSQYHDIVVDYAHSITHPISRHECLLRRFHRGPKKERDGVCVLCRSDEKTAPPPETLRSFPGCDRHVVHDPVCYRKWKEICASEKLDVQCPLCTPDGKMKSQS